MRRLLFALLIAVAGCDGSGPQGPAASQTPSPAATRDAGRAEPCDAYRPEQPRKRPRGLLGPEEAEVATIERGAPTRVEGFLPFSPDDFLAAITAMDLKILFQETEGFEAEAVVTNGRFQAFWKVFDRCEGGSQFLAFIDPVGR